MLRDFHEQGHSRDPEFHSFLVIKWGKSLLHYYIPLLSIVARLPMWLCHPLWGSQERELGEATLALHLWNDQEARSTTNTVFAVWCEKAWFWLIRKGGFFVLFCFCLWDSELFIAISSEYYSVSKGCPLYFIDWNMGIFGELMIISQLRNPRVETGLLFFIHPGPDASLHSELCVPAQLSAA